jgi:hypothetical protein
LKQLGVVASSARARNVLFAAVREFTGERRRTGRAFVTVATAYAWTGAGSRALLGVMADSRLSWRDGDDGHAEIAVKTHDVGPRVAAVSAGGVIVGPQAAELARAVLNETDARKPGSAGLWPATRLFAYFAREAHREHMRSRDRRMAPNEFALTGFYENGAPGVAQIEIAGDVERVRFWRPIRDHLACVTIGDSAAKRLVRGAYERCGNPGSRFADWNNAVASAIWYAIKSESETFRTVGRGLSVGLCSHEHKRFTWPLVVVDRELYYRGVPVAGRMDPEDFPKSVLRLDADTNYAAALDQAVEDARTSGQVQEEAPPDFECTIEELVGASPFRRTPEPRELNFMYL